MGTTRNKIKKEHKSPGMHPLAVVLVVCFGVGLVLGRAAPRWMSASLAAGIADMITGSLTQQTTGFFALFRSVYAVCIALEGAILLCGLCWCPALPLMGFFICLGCGVGLCITTVATVYGAEAAPFLLLAMLPLFIASTLCYLGLANLVAEAFRRLINRSGGRPKGIFAANTAKNYAVKLLTSTAILGLSTLVYCLIKSFFIALPAV